MQKPKISMIYLDMDGVIADFSKRYKELYRMEPREAEKKISKYPNLIRSECKPGTFFKENKSEQTDLRSWLKLINK